jgi:hypothetical protein
MWRRGRLYANVKSLYRVHAAPFTPSAELKALRRSVDASQQERSEDVQRLRARVTELESGLGGEVRDLSDRLRVAEAAASTAVASHHRAVDDLAAADAEVQRLKQQLTQCREDHATELATLTSEAQSIMASGVAEQRSKDDVIKRMQRELSASQAAAKEVRPLCICLCFPLHRITVLSMRLLHPHRLRELDFQSLSPCFVAPALKTTMAVVFGE